MESRGPEALAVAVLFILGIFAIPIHLMVDAHEWDHHEDPEPEDHEHSHHEPHPSADHQFVPVSPVARTAPVVVEMVAIEIAVLAPQAQTWTPTVEAEANSPPSSPESPPRSPRSPPL